jgi:hypothetical protein
MKNEPGMTNVTTGDGCACTAAAISSTRVDRKHMTDSDIGAMMPVITNQIKSNLFTGRHRTDQSKTSKAKNKNQTHQK